MINILKTKYESVFYHVSIMVSRPMIYKILHRSRKNNYSIHQSTNARFHCLKYGIRRLAKTEKEIEERLNRKAKRYNKDYPGQMIHGDTKRFSLLKDKKATETREYLFVAIDYFSQELFAAILPNKTQYSA